VLVASAEGVLDEPEPMDFSRWCRPVIEMILQCVTVLKGNINRGGLKSQNFPVFTNSSQQHPQEHHLDDTNSKTITMATYDSMKMGLLKNQAPLSGVDAAKSGNSQTRLTDDVGEFDDRSEATGSVHNQDGVIGNDVPYPGTEAGGIPATSLQTDIPSGPPHTRRRTLLKLLSFWVGTIVFTALVVMLVMVYWGTGVITPTQKNTYNLASVVLILILGLSFFVRSPFGPVCRCC